MSVGKMHREYEIVFEIPFNSMRKWHLVIARKNGTNIVLGQILPEHHTDVDQFISFMYKMPFCANV